MSESAQSQSSTSQPGWSPGVESTSDGSTQHSLIGPTVVIKGEVTAEEDLMIMGRVEGFINHSQTVTIHAQGTVAAEVKARQVLVEGTVDGNVYGTERIEIAETGNVSGNVYAPRVGVLEGASFKGTIDMDADSDAIERRFRQKAGIEDKPSKTAGKSPNDDKSLKVDSKTLADAGSSVDVKTSKVDGKTLKSDSKGGVGGLTVDASASNDTTGESNVAEEKGNTNQASGTDSKTER